MVNANHSFLSSLKRVFGKMTKILHVYIGHSLWDTKYIISKTDLNEICSSGPPMLDIELLEDHSQLSACRNLFRCSSCNQSPPNLLKFLFEFQLFMVDQVRLLNLISMEDGKTHNERSKGFHCQASPTFVTESYAVGLQQPYSSSSSPFVKSNLLSLYFFSPNCLVHSKYFSLLISI